MATTTKHRLVILGRLAFCSLTCLDIALEGDTRTGRLVTTVSERMARVIQCYGCGQYLDEMEG